MTPPSQGTSSSRDDLETTDFESHLCTLKARFGVARSACPHSRALASLRSITSKMRLKDINPLLAETHAQTTTAAQGVTAGQPEWLVKVVGSLLALSLLGCATAPSDGLDWQSFVATFAGEPLRSVDYPSGAMKTAMSATATASIESGTRKFESWCSAHGGRSGLTQVLATSSPSVASFHQALSAKLNGDQALGLPWTPKFAIACVENKAARELVAVMISVEGPKNEARERDGKVLEKVTRVFFDGGQAADFSAAYVKREADRASRLAEDFRARDAARAEATDRLHRHIRVGDRTSLGVVVDIRPPLALIQYDQRYVRISGRPAAEWLPIESLSAPSD